MKERPNYAFNATPELALRSNWAILPARVNAALGFQLGFSTMSYDNDKTIYSLTPSGWIVEEPHPDAVERWSRHVYQASGWSREHITWSCLWVNPDVPRPERDRIRNKYREFMGTPGRGGNCETVIGKPL